MTAQRSEYVAAIGYATAPGVKVFNFTQHSSEAKRAESDDTQEVIWAANAQVLINCLRDRQPFDGANLVVADEQDSMIAANLTVYEFNAPVVTSPYDVDAKLVAADRVVLHETFARNNSKTTYIKGDQLDTDRYSARQCTEAVHRLIARHKDHAKCRPVGCWCTNPDGDPIIHNLYLFRRVDKAKAQKAADAKQKRRIAHGEVPCRTLESLFYTLTKAAAAYFSGRRYWVDKWSDPRSREDLYADVPALARRIALLDNSEFAARPSGRVICRHALDTNICRGQSRTQYVPYWELVLSIRQYRRALIKARDTAQFGTWLTDEIHACIAWRRAQKEII